MVINEVFFFGDSKRIHKLNTSVRLNSELTRRRKNGEIINKKKTKIVESSQGTLRASIPHPRNRIPDKSAELRRFSTLPHPPSAIINKDHANRLDLNFFPSRFFLPRPEYEARHDVNVP
jgi:hypothetical protein